jgi:hypothetical protein
MRTPPVFSQKKTIKDCDRQLDSLYVYFGKFLYENIEKENIYYCFESRDKRLEEQASAFLQKIKTIAYECGKKEESKENSP